MLQTVPWVFQQSRRAWCCQRLARAGSVHLQCDRGSRWLRQEEQPRGEESSSAAGPRGTLDAVLPRSETLAALKGSRSNAGESAGVVEAAERDIVEFVGWEIRGAATDTLTSE